MKYWIALALFFCSSVFAQAPRPPCYGMVSGPYVGTPKLIKGSEGSHLFWLCSVGGVKQSYGFSWRQEDYSLSKAMWIMQLPTRATRREIVANAMWDDNTYRLSAHLTEDSAKGRLARERGAIYQANKAAWGVK